MVESIVTTVLNLVENFTFKRFIALGVVLMALVSTLYIYENYTDNFKLSRLQKSAEVLLTLQEIKSNDIEKNKSLLPIYKDIENELATLSDPENPASLSFSPENAGIKKYLATFSPWLLMAVVAYIQQKRKKENQPNLALGFITMGLVFGGIGYMLPTLLWPWINLVFFPIFHILFIGIIGGITIPQFYSYRKKAQEAKEGLTN